MVVVLLFLFFGASYLCQTREANALSRHSLTDTVSKVKALESEAARYGASLPHPSRCRVGSHGSPELIPSDLDHVSGTRRGPVNSRVSKHQ